MNLLNLKNNSRENFCLRFLLIYLVSQAFLRLLLFFNTPGSISTNIFDITKTFILGSFFDIVVGIQALIPLFILLILIPSKWFSKNFVQKFLKTIVFFMFLLMFFISISEYLFWDEFQTKFNFIAVDYLIYTTELLGNINQSYNLWLIIPSLIAVTLLATYFLTRYLPKKVEDISWKNKFAYICLALLLPVLFFYTIDNKWRNFASINKYNVEISGNGAYEFVSAFNNNELDYYSFYVTQEDEKVMYNLREIIATPEATFLDDNTISRYIKNERPLKTPNIILIVVESLSADFLGSFGNTENLTPYLDKLSKESMFFTNVYATGTRTVRGLEALSLSIPPTPGQSILRRPDNKDLFVLSSVLQKQNYTNLFIYGGYGYFDNMNDFFAGNNYEVIDRTDIPKEAINFENVWGVADEIIFDQALKEIDERTKNDEKVFQLIMTTSNHRPFTYPDDRIDLPQGTRESAVKYTDWAIGDFIEKAKQKDWFDNTIFIIVADHQAKSAGRVDLPVNKYKIPLMIYGENFVKPSVNNRLMSQIDVIPTVLSLLGHSYQSKFLGYDINNLEVGKERAFISTYQNLGYIKGDKLVILKPQNKVETYKINNFSTSDYTPIKNEPQLTNEAISWYQGSSYLYKNKLLKND